MLGKLIEGRYQIIQNLSIGEFCQTHLVEDTYQPGHPICIVKHFKSSDRTISWQELRWLFTRQVEALKKLGSHAQVPQLLAYFENKQEFYLVQEFIEGHPLSEELSLGSRWSESQVVQLLQEVLGILEFVHSYVLIHRNLHPSNLIRRQDERLVLIDFGCVQQAWTQVVKFQGQTRTNITISLPGTIGSGTPGYMPIEQEQGNPCLNSDIYALGIIGIQALTGLEPTLLLKDPDTSELIWQHQAQVSKALAGVLTKMVRHDFQKRYKSATEVLQALLPLTNLKPIKSVPILLPVSAKLEYETHKEGIAKLPLAGKSSTTVTIERQASQPKPDINKVFESKTAGSILEEQTLDTAVAISRTKSALLIGLVIGVTSGLVLMVVSYYSLQLPAPTPQVQTKP